MVVTGLLRSMSLPIGHVHLVLGTDRACFQKLHNALLCLRVV